MNLGKICGRAALSLFGFWFLTGAPTSSGQVKSFVLGRFEVAPGGSWAGYLPVPEKDGIGTSIPVIIFHGVQKGKVLALVAGVHGCEYPPMLALYRLKKTIDPKRLSGTLLIIPIAHLPSFQRRTIYYDPSDWKNLNRVFPGDPQGTLSQRIASVLTENVVKKCDVLIDLHCGDANEALIPYTYWMVSGNPKLDEETKQLALAFGLKTIIIDEFKPKDLADSRYLGNTAIVLGKAAITTERGFLGRTDEEMIEENLNGVLNVMKLYKMIEGSPQTVSNPVWVDKYEVVFSKHDGLFYPDLKMGDTVAQGQKVGSVTDYLGNVLEEVKAPFHGVLLYIIATPPANKGEPLFEVGRIQQK
jgi:uncharacterized protein